MSVRYQPYLKRLNHWHFLWWTTLFVHLIIDYHILDTVFWWIKIWAKTNPVNPGNEKISSWQQKIEKIVNQYGRVYHIGCIICIIIEWLWIRNRMGETRLMEMWWDLCFPWDKMKGIILMKKNGHKICTVLSFLFLLPFC